MNKTKTCANPKCKLLFEFKSPKKMFCSLYCKNQAAYIYSQTNYSWEIKMQKARRKNIQILEYLLNNNFFNMKYEELKKMGFNPSVAIIPTKDPKERTLFRYGNIGMIIISPTEVELFKIKTN
jgi:hypothetical protein